MSRSTPLCPLAYFDARDAELAAMNPPKKPEPVRVPHVPSGRVMLTPMEYMDARIAELHADDLALKAVIAGRAKPAAAAPVLTGSYEDLMAVLCEGRAPVTLFPADEALAPHATSPDLLAV